MLRGVVSIWSETFARKTVAVACNLMRTFPCAAFGGCWHRPFPGFSRSDFVFKGRRPWIFCQSCYRLALVVCRQTMENIFCHFGRFVAVAIGLISQFCNLKVRVWKFCDVHKWVELRKEKSSLQLQLNNWLIGPRTITTEPQCAYSPANVAGGILTDAWFPSQVPQPTWASRYMSVGEPD